MPALDPFSASSRPMYPFDNSPSHPLPFAATLQPINSNIQTKNAAPSSSSTSLPKPKKNYKDVIPSSFPTPAYSHSRQTSFDFRHVDAAMNQSMKSSEVGSDEWMQSRVADCVDSANGLLDLKSLGLNQLSTKIADLRDLVTLPSSFSPRASSNSFRPPQSPGTGLPPSPIPDFEHLSPGSGHLSANSRSFSRTTSAPASSSFFNNLNAPSHPRAAFGRTPSGLGGRVVSGSTDGDVSENDSASTSTPRLLASPPLVTAPSIGIGRPVQQRAFSRSKTGAVNLNNRSVSAKNTSLEILLGGNFLRSLPTALFEISNITVLSLRSNKLKELPAAIGALRNLTELNISNNDITELPSTILDLNLTLFSVHPNPFHRKIDVKTADPASFTLTQSGRLFGPLHSQSHHRGSEDESQGGASSHSKTPRLYDLCLNLLISPRPPSNLPPLLDRYQWDPPVKGGKHPLLDPTTLNELIPCVSERRLRQALQAMRSASHAYASDPADGRRGSTVSIGMSQRQSSQLRVDPFPRSHRPTPPDNAAENPYFYPCPSPRHHEFSASSTDEESRPSRHLFIQSAEERLEWCDVHGESGLPIRWKGCSPGCLDYLTEEGDDWGLDEQDE